MKEDQSIDVRGAKIYVHREGRDGDIPIVLVHGIVLTHDMWRYQVSYLTENGYQVIAPDLRGFGDSHADNPEDPANYTYEVWADDLRAVIDHFQLQHIIIAGYSMGGAVVLRYMLGSHEPVDKLVLVSTTGPCMHARLPSLFETLRLWETCIGLGAFVKLLEHFNKDVVLERFINSAYPHILKLDDEALRTDLLEWIEGMFKKADRQALISGLLQMQKRDLTPGVSAILKPTRICHGEDDPFVPYALAKYQQRLMPAELTGFEMTGHGIFFEPKRNLLNEKLAW